MSVLFLVAGEGEVEEACQDVVVVALVGCGRVRGIVDGKRVAVYLFPVWVE